MADSGTMVWQAAHRLTGRLAGLLALAGAAVLAPDHVHAQDGELPPISAEQPVTFVADYLEYDDQLDVVTARGNVEITQADRTVLADVVTFNQLSDIVTASGNVSLLEPTGEVIFTDFAELTGDLKNAVISNLGVLLSDNARIAASVAQRRDGNYTELGQAVYSPCAVCEEDPTSPPLWQIKAERVVYDQVEEEVRYRNATLEFFGIPLLYTPYLEHPGPNIARKTGILAPTFGNNTQLGGFARLPVYIVIDDQSDIIIEPYLTTSQSIVLATEFRERMSFGELNLNASATFADRVDDDGITKEGSFRGHLDFLGAYAIDEHWRASHNIQLSTDDTYRRLYGFPSSSILTSNARLEGFYGKSYVSADLYAYRDQRALDDDAETPFVFPYVQANYVSEFDDWGGYWTADADLRTIFRQEEGSDNVRLSLAGGWHLPYTSSIGELYDFNVSLRGDLYYVRDFVDELTGEAFPDGFTGRIFPQASLTWRYPLVRYVAPYQITLEPRLGVVVAPFGNNPEDIPDEDSRDFDLDDSNLFAANRFPGKDTVDPGQRFNYGLNLAAAGESGGYSSLFLGQSFQVQTDESYRTGSGVTDQLSDIVGRLEIRPDANFTFVDRFRIDVGSGDLVRHDIQLALGPPALRGNLSYVFLKSSDVTGEFDDREQVVANLSSQIDDQWRLSSGITFDLNEGETRTANASLTYEDECFIFSGTFVRDFFEDREIQQSDTLIFRVALKTLGEFSF